MDGSNNSILNIERVNIHSKTNQKQVSFSNNNPKFFLLSNSNDSLDKNINTNPNPNADSLNNNNIDENNTSMNLFKDKLFSPRKSRGILPTRKQSFQTPWFRTTFKKPEFDSTNNNENTQNNLILRNSNANVNTFANSFKKSQIGLIRTNVNSSIKPRESAFTLKNKKMSSNILFSNIKCRNSDLDTMKIKPFMKIEGDEKTGTTHQPSDRNKNQNNNHNSISRRNSINNNNKIIKTNITNKKFGLRRINTITSSITGKYNFFQKRNKYNMMKNKNKIKNTVPTIVNPLLVSEEDKIFDEMKKYLCFKYEKKKSKAKSQDQKKVAKTTIYSSKPKKMINKLQTIDKIKLDYLYSNTTKINKKINYIKKRKDKEDLAEYQNKLLDAIKPTVSDYTYGHLKDKFIDIRIKNNKKYQYNYRKIKEIENEEEEIINEFNNTCVNCLRTFKRVRAQKEMIHSTNLRLKLPLLSFTSCLKRKKKIHMKKK